MTRQPPKITPPSPLASRWTRTVGTSLAHWWGQTRLWATEARLLRWLTLLWAIVGFAVLLSASYASAQTEQGDGLYYCKRQLIWLVGGFGVFSLLSAVPLRLSLALANWVTLTLLGLTWVLLVPGVGTSAYGAVRWIELGGVVPIQPSELLKPALVAQSARILGQWERLGDAQRWFWLGTVVLTVAGILLQPNLSTATLFGVVLWLLAVAAGLPWVYLLGTAAGGLLLAMVSVAARSYQQRRITSFLNPWVDPLGDGYQLVQSLLAIGSGGWWGAGFGLSRQKLANLPIQFTDFIFSVFAEEFGFVGCLGLLLLLASYGALGLRVAAKATNATHRLVALGMVVLLLGQAILNVGVATGVLPTTGLPFPLMSYGGSSIAASLVAAGLLVRAARETNAATVVAFDRRRPS